jgi:hypothetical protein
MSDPQDRRVVRIVLTDGGQRLLHGLSGAGVDYLRDSLQSMNTCGGDDLRRGLSRFLHAVEETGEVPHLEDAATAH